LYANLTIIFILIVLQIASLIRFVNKTNIELANFLESVRYADFTHNFQIQGMGNSFDELKETFSSIMQDFQRIRSEKEEHYYYLKNIIEHVNVSIIAYRENGEVEMINNAAKKMFGNTRIKNIDDLRTWSLALVHELKTLRGGNKSLVKVNQEEDILQLSVSVKEFIINGITIFLVTIKDIQSELDEHEMEAWQKLIRVLTHEIMNSIAPISSLTSTANVLIKEVAEQIDETNSANLIENIDDVQTALKTIEKRSNGLIHFVETYRNLTKIPKPNFSIFPIEKLFNHVYSLLKETLRKNNIQIKIQIEPQNLEVTADEQLLEQVIINLLSNSIQAIAQTENGIIELNASQNTQNKVVIQIIDNGQGILSDVKDKIFIPFFTTKQNGSGIGLSLSRQILRLHNGTINVKSEPNVETIFTLVL
jgi:signal transduction histidine kinase